MQKSDTPTPTITRYDGDGNVVRRVIATDKTDTTATFITQVPDGAGGWNNITVERRSYRNRQGATT